MQEKGLASGQDGENAALLLSVLPPRLSAELLALAGGRAAFFSRIEELRLRAEGRCSVVFRAEQSLLRETLSQEEMQALMLRLCGGSVYAFEECIAEGYIPWENGMRIGICGRARYEGAAFRGVCEVRSLVFRFPHAAQDALCTAVREAFLQARRGLLILSPPGGGKTTALRALAHWLGTGKAPKRVVVVDERLEFSPAAYRDATVDLLRGYDRVRALEIAHRCLNPEVVLLDEIGGREEAEGLSALLRGGAIAVATAHAGAPEDIFLRGALRPFATCAVFDVLLYMERRKSGFYFETKRCEYRKGEEGLCSTI